MDSDQKIKYLQEDIEYLKWQLKNTKEKQEQAYLRGLKEGYSKGSEAGVKLVADHMALMVNPPFMVMGGTVSQIKHLPGILGGEAKVVKSPIGDNDFEWVTAEEASARLVNQKRTIEGYFKRIKELQGKLDKIYDPYNASKPGPPDLSEPRAAEYPLGGPSRTEQKPVSEDKPVNHVTDTWLNDRQYDTGDPWDGC